MTKQTALLVAASLAALSAPALSQTAPVPPPPPATPLKNGAELSNGSEMIRVTALTDTILRVRIARGAFPEDASWAVSAETRGKSVQVEPLVYADISTDKGNPMRVAFFYDVAPNTAANFIAFLEELDAKVPAGLAVHLVLEGGSSHVARDTRWWFVDHPRFHPHDPQAMPPG